MSLVIKESRSQFLSDEVYQAIEGMINAMCAKFYDKKQKTFRSFSLLTPQYRLLHLNVGLFMWKGSEDGQTQEKKENKTKITQSGLYYVEHTDGKGKLIKIEDKETIENTIVAFLIDQCMLEPKEVKFACRSAEELDVMGYDEEAKAFVAPDRGSYEGIIEKA